MANDGPSMLKLLLNRKILGFMMKSRTRKLMKSMKDGNIFLSELDKKPDKEAIIYGEKRFTYKAFKERINRLNNGLLSLGLKGGDHIAAFLGNSNVFLEVIYGTSLAGIYSTPINWHLKGDEIEYVVNNSDSQALFIDEEFLDRIMPNRSRLKSVKNFIVVGEKVPEGMIPYERFLSESAGAELKTTTRGGGFMLYTSGTTGRPKGTHSRSLEDPSVLDPSDIAAFVQMIDNIMNGFDYCKTTNIHLAAGPLYHGGPIGFVGSTFANGGTVVIMDKFDSEETLRLIEKEKVSTTFMAPILLRRILECPTKEKYNVSSMKSIVCGAAPCPVELKKRVVDYFGPVLYELYGSTDGAVNSILRPKHYLKDPKKFASVGQIAPGNKILIVDENNNTAPTGTIGDLYVTNAMVKYLEYYKDPDKTENSFVDFDGKRYFIEGEVAYLDDEGFCYIVDRKKDMIISGGVNIYPVEIEEVIFLHESVSDVAVIGVPDEEWGESVKACITLKEDKSATEEEIIEYCNERLAGYKRPKSVDFLGEIPRNPDGKLMKRKLRERYKSAVK